MLLATGSIHPESGGWYLDEPVELRYADGHWTIIIRDSQFHVVVDGQPPEDLATFRNEVAAVVQGCLDGLGFLLAVPLQVEVRSLVIDGNPIQLVLRQHGWPELLDTAPGLPPRVDTADLVPFITAAATELQVRVALADLRAALQYHDDTCFYAYRAVESVRRWFLQEGKADKGTAKSKSWDDMRSALRADEEELRWLKAQADARRHGAAVAPTEAERLRALRIARPTVRAFIEHLHARQPSAGESSN
jgi:hypothetical protein